MANNGVLSRHLPCLLGFLRTLSHKSMSLIYIDLQDGKGPQLFTGDPKAIPLKDHEVITLEITPPTVSPPPSFTFSSGL